MNDDYHTSQPEISSTPPMPPQSSQDETTSHSDTLKTMPILYVNNTYHINPQDTSQTCPILSQDDSDHQIDRTGTLGAHSTHPQDNFDHRTAQNGDLNSQIILSQNNLYYQGPRKKTSETRPILPQKIKKPKFEVVSTFLDDEFSLRKEEKLYKCHERAQKILERLSKCSKDDLENSKIVVTKQIEQIRNEWPVLFNPKYMKNIYVHVDLDSFYASCEILRNPAYKDIPIGIGSKTMLATSNYKAREYGVKAGMPGYLAQRLCPQLVIVPADFPRYNYYSDLVMNILSHFDTNIEIYGIDEACLVFDNEKLAYAFRVWGDNEIFNNTVGQYINKSKATIFDTESNLDSEETAFSMRNRLKGSALAESKELKHIHDCSNTNLEENHISYKSNNASSQMEHFIRNHQAIHNSPIENLKHHVCANNSENHTNSECFDHQETSFTFKNHFFTPNVAFLQNSDTKDILTLGIENRALIRGQNITENKYTNTNQQLSQIQAGYENDSLKNHLNSQTIQQDSIYEAISTSHSKKHEKSYIYHYNGLKNHQSLKLQPHIENPSLNKYHKKPILGSHHKDKISHSTESNMFEIYGSPTDNFKYDGKLSFQNVEYIVDKIRGIVHRITGLTISAGISVCRGLAKFASTINKPDGQYIIRKNFAEFLANLNVDEINGIGKYTKEMLQKTLQIYKIKEIQEKAYLLNIILREKTFVHLLRLSFGLSVFDRPSIIEDLSCVKSKAREISIIPTDQFQDILTILWDASVELEFGLVKGGYFAQTVTFRIRKVNFESKTVQKKLKSPVQSQKDIFNASYDLFCTVFCGGNITDPVYKTFKTDMKINLIGVRVSELIDKKPFQSIKTFGGSRILPSSRSCPICNKQFYCEPQLLIDSHVDMCLKKFIQKEKQKSSNILTFVKKSNL